MSVRQLPPALLKKAEEELGEVPSRIPDDLRAIKEWLSKQPHIIANLDDQWLLAFLRGCKFSLERTKEKLENYHTAKTLVPEIMIPDDPADKAFLELFRTGACVALKKPVTEDGVCVIIFRPGVCDPQKFTIFQNMRINYMITEILMLENDNFTVAGVKVVGDMKNMTMGHFSQMTPTTAQKMAICGEKSMPIRQKGGHHINTPPGIETIFNLFTRFMSEKLKSRLFIHNQNMDELYKHVPRECLPTELGGDAGPISDLVDHWEKKILSYREYFLKARNFKTDESKRIGKPKTAEDIFGVDGSFRSLSVD